jgi:hypothetical protein
MMPKVVKRMVKSMSTPASFAMVMDCGGNCKAGISLTASANALSIFIDTHTNFN